MEPADLPARFAPALALPHQPEADVCSQGESSVSWRALAPAPCPCLFEHSPPVAYAPPRLVKLSLFSSTQLTAQQATLSFREYCSTLHLAFRPCSGRVFDIWPLSLLLITLISVIVLTFIFILLLRKT